MLAAQIPAWVDHRALDASFPHGYGMPIPAGAGEGLRAAAMMYAEALAPCTGRERHAVLTGMRSSTIVIIEEGIEADATIKLLRVHLDDVPLDILQAACRAQDRDAIRILMAEQAKNEGGGSGGGGGP